MWLCGGYRPSLRGGTLSTGTESHRKYRDPMFRPEPADSSLFLLLYYRRTRTLGCTSLLCCFGLAGPQRSSHDANYSQVLSGKRDGSGIAHSYFENCKLHLVQVSVSPVAWVAHRRGHVTATVTVAVPSVWCCALFRWHQ